MRLASVIAAAFSGVGGSVSNKVTAIFMGQSEVEYLFNTGTFYRQLPQPSNVPNGNLRVITQSGDLVAPVETTVTPTTVAAGQVNPAMAAMACFLNYARPGYTFVVGDAAVPGTTRSSLADDSTDETAGADGNKRYWSDFTSVIDKINTDHGGINTLVECWYNADANWINNFKNTFWPLYFGVDGNGNTVNLGSNYTAGALTYRVDHCLWDANASSGVGRGVLDKSETSWQVLTPMPFFNAPTDTELTNFSDNNARLSEPDRQVMTELANDTIAQTVDIVVGPSAHVCKFGGSSTIIHPDVGTKDGQIQLMWPFALSLLRTSGMTILEPEIVDVECPIDGSYADVVVSLPNGGTLTTLAGFRGTSYSGTSPHQQSVTGFEVTVAGTRRPVYKTTESSYSAEFRGTVAIVDAGSGTGVARVGKVRITPEVPYQFGATISYLRGQATAALLLNRDLDLYPYFLIEHIPSLYDATATYPFEGVAVKPYQADMAIPVPAPAFMPRSAAFDGSDYYSSNTISVASGTQGMLSMWIRNTQATWNTPAAARVFQFRVGTLTVFELQTTSAGRYTLRLSNDTETDTLTFNNNGTAMVVGQWYHLAFTWTSTTLRVFVNGVQIGTLSYTNFDFANATLTQIGVCAQSTGANPMTADIGHLWLDFGQWLDLTLSANMEKFINDTSPADAGPNGQLVTGTNPQYYFDGDAPAWSNQGTAGNVTLTGTLAVGAVPAI